MIDFLYKFNVLNTAFSVIGSEIKAKFGEVGGCWHVCLLLWTLYFGIQGLWNDSIDYYNMQYISGCVFLISSKYLLFMQNVVQKIKYIRFLDFSLFRKIATFALNVSIFPVLWFFALVPFYNGVSSTIKLFSGTDGSYKYGAIVSFFLLAFLSVLVCRFIKSGKVQTRKTSTTLKTRTRPPSARIMARQNQNGQKTRPASATPVKRKHV